MQKGAGAVVEDKLDDAVLLDRAVAFREVIAPHPAVGVVKEPLPVDSPGLDVPKLSDDFPLVGLNPPSLGLQVLFDRLRGPGLDRGHHEAVGEDVDLGVDSHSLVVGAEVGLVGRASGHDDAHQAVEVLVVDVVEVDEVLGGLSHLNTVQTSEVFAELDKCLLGVVDLDVANRLSVIVQDGKANLELGSAVALADL